MSLESKLANLSLGDETSVVEAIKADGVEKSGFASNISGLIAKCASKDDAEAIAALTTVKAVAEGASEAEAFNSQCLSAALQQASSKNGDVKKAAAAAALAICKNITPFTMKALLPAIFSQLPVEKRWEVRALALIASLYLMRRPQNSSEMPFQR
jgi:hypothetical protein